MTRKWHISVLILFLFHGIIWSQEDVKISRGSFKTGIDTGFKEAWESVKNGDKNLRAGEGTYHLDRDIISMPCSTTPIIPP